MGPLSQQGSVLPLDRFPFAARPLMAWIATIAAVGLALWLRHAADATLPSGFPFLTFFPAVILVSVLLGARYGAVAAALGGVLSWYYFIPPAYTFKLDAGSLAAMGFYALVVVTDVLIIHWLQRANGYLAAERERNAALAHTRALLFDELQHRVSNNLQAVAGLLALQRRRVTDPQAAATLAEASQRVALIGRISRRLYDSDENGRDLAAFLTALLDDVVEANGRSDIARRVDCPPDLKLSTEQALPVALVVAESIANAIEHGLPDHRAPAIAIEVLADGREIQISVVDNGGTLPPDFTVEATDSLGLSIATMLARQTGGSYAVTGGIETRACLVLPQASGGHPAPPPIGKGSDDR
ncbi:sensor histidine kinase [Sphingomonas dokdonensis]|nr:histidine kinase dimerization/phosphoacceptor domain -containing protein [Sphingomonas dokdonensis]